MAHLLLVRHSMPDIDPSVAARHWKLSDEGRRRCTVLAEMLSAYRPAVIVSSVEPKAAETAAIVAASLGLPLETEVDLHEHERSHDTRFSQEAFQRAIACLFAQPEDLVFGTETAAQAQRRFGQAVDRLLARYPGETIAVVAHGTVISLFVADRCSSVDGYTLWRQLGLPACIILSLPDFALETVTSVGPTARQTPASNI
ncbi:MAG: histidine phosphatase family protein [Anaerolineae bacterium]